MSAINILTKNMSIHAYIVQNYGHSPQYISHHLLLFTRTSSSHSQQPYSQLWYVIYTHMNTK